MEEEPRYLRRTTTSLRYGKRRQAPVGRYAFVLAIIGLFAIAFTQLPTSDSGLVSLMSECSGDSCPTPAVAARADATATPLPALACPYCNQDPDRWRSVTSVAPPEIGGVAAVVLEASCSQMLYGLNPRTRLPPASLTKIATALVTVERGRLSDRIAVKLNGWELTATDGSSIMGLEEGMLLSVEELLYGLMLASGNDAALALGDYFGSLDRLVSLMNARVISLGLQDTRFTNPDGRHDPGQYSTPLDMALLGQELLRNPKLQQVVTTPSYTPAWENGPIMNSNAMLLIYPGAQGIKTGYTDEGNYTIVSAVTWEGRQLIAAVFGSWNLYTDSVRLLDWAYDHTTPICNGTPGPAAASATPTPVSSRP
jgi:D-alanyl-D-alanine carboxypeptidase